MVAVFACVGNRTRFQSGAGGAGLIPWLVTKGGKADREPLVGGRGGGEAEAEAEAETTGPDGGDSFAIGCLVGLELKAGGCNVLSISCSS